MADEQPVETTTEARATAAADKARRELARRAAQARRNAATERAERTNRQASVAAVVALMAGLCAAALHFLTPLSSSDGTADPSATASSTAPSAATLRDVERAASTRDQPTRAAALGGDSLVFPTSTPVVAESLAPASALASESPSPPSPSLVASPPREPPVASPTAGGQEGSVTVPPPRFPGAVQVERVPAAGGIFLRTTTGGRSLQDLLIEEVELAFERALEAANAAAKIQDEARLQALIGEGVAAAARREDPGFAAHYLEADTIHARVSYVQTDGSSYAGQWRDFRDHGYQPHGSGQFMYGSGSVYAGQFSVGRPGGVGVWERRSGRYIGEFRTGKPWGLGVETLPSKRTYLGEFLAGRPGGYGVLARAGGVRYVGQLVGGKREGAGVEMFPDGRIERGLWVGDRLETKVPPPRADVIAALDPLAPWWP